MKRARSQCAIPVMLELHWVVLDFGGMMFGMWF